MATLATPLSPSRTFRPSRRVDPRLWVGGGLGVFAAVAVIVYSTPRQGADAAAIVIDHAKVVRVGRPDSGVATGTSSFGGSTANSRASSLVLDLDLDQAARLAAATHTSTIDVALVAPAEDAP